MIDIKSVEINEPVLLNDANFGLIIRIDEDTNQIGVQVPLEQNIRWINADKLLRDGALIQL